MNGPNERTPNRSVARTLTTGILSLFLVPIFWFLTKMETTGFVLAWVWVNTQPPSLSNISGWFAISAIVDFLLWFSGLWGAWTLWRRFPSTKGVLGAKLLCALSIAFYPLLGTALLFHHGTLWSPTPVLAATFAVSLLVCFGTIDGLYALALRLYQNSNA